MVSAQVDHDEASNAVGPLGEAGGRPVVGRRLSDDRVHFTEVGILTASDGAPTDYFGYSVAVDGNVMVVGAYGDNCDDGSENCGAAYVYHTSDNWANWTEVKLTASDAASDDDFGGSVAVSGNLVAVGAYEDDDGGSASGSGGASSSGVENAGGDGEDGSAATPEI